MSGVVAQAFIPPVVTDAGTFTDTAITTALEDPTTAAWTEAVLEEEGLAELAELLQAVREGRGVSRTEMETLTAQNETKVRKALARERSWSLDWNPPQFFARVTPEMLAPLLAKPRLGQVAGVAAGRGNQRVTTPSHPGKMEAISIHDGASATVQPVVDNIVAIFGGGKMGSEVGYHLLSLGFKVRIYDADPLHVNVIAGTQAKIEGLIAKGVRSGNLTEAQAAAMRRNIAYFQPNADLKEVVAGAGFVFEAIRENLEAKAGLFAQLNGIADPNTIFLTNTSMLSVNGLAQFSGRPDRFAGAHFFWPAYVNALLEITPADHTDPNVLARIHAFGQKARKSVVESPDITGFVVDRFFVPWLNEAALLRERLIPDGIRHDGLVPSNYMVLIDDVAREVFGIGLGPFELMNVTGPNITYLATGTLSKKGAYFRPARSLRDLVELTDEQEVPAWPIPSSNNPDKRKRAREIRDQQQTILARMREVLGGGRYQAERSQIADRLLGVMVRAVTNLVSRGVSPETIDRAVRIGLDWPEGPFAIIRSIGVTRAQALAEAIQEEGFFPVATLPEDISTSSVSLLVDAKTGIARIRLERPAKMNVLTPELVADLARRFDEAEHDDRVQVIVIEGVKGSLAGADIGFFTSNLTPEANANDNEGLRRILDFTRAGLELFERIDVSEKTVITVLDGNTFGGGLELALAGDIIIATPRARLALPETSLGIIPGLMGGPRLAEIIGRPLTFYHLVTGNTTDGAFSAQEAYAIGLVDLLVDPGEVETVIAELAKIDGLQKEGRVESLERLAAIEKLFSDRQKERDLLEGVEHPEDPLYTEILGVAAARPRSALQLAAEAIDWAEIKGLERMLTALNVLFRTPMAIQGLQSMGRNIQVRNRTKEEFLREVLTPLGDHSKFIVVSGPVVLISGDAGHPKTKEEAWHLAIILSAHIKNLDAEGKINDLALVKLKFTDDKGEVSDFAILRQTPGGPFEVK